MIVRSRLERWLRKHISWDIAVQVGIYAGLASVLVISIRYPLIGIFWLGVASGLCIAALVRD